MLSSSLEKYLVGIYKMALADTELKSTDVAKEINQPLQKTIQALQRMHYQKYIVYLPYQPLKITEQGKQMAEYLIAREALIDEFLTLLQIEENKDLEKESMQQYLSYESLERIEKFVLFNRQYPEIVQRYKLLTRKKLTHRLLPALPDQERL
ncbi:metal-dependent transcriptional regulator [Cellulosilyticum sp. I15G10I2]|uniref:metal-dependent transcriptional regulator n=1 Tax=Cellulosilyticum sp. I15G10I2 TaxID=1892843 RepID=UPI00085C0723|nr:iron dependent repressor, metal binding and dimerization domain protein [Cellulosilyticum sp. I15G10I2]